MIIATHMVHIAIAFSTPGVGGVKLGRIDRFRVLTRKTLANLQ